MQIARHLLSIGLLLGAVGLNAQTAVTTSGGTANTVPIFTGASAVGNSVITQSGSNVGIGTTTPAAVLDVNGSIGLKGINAIWQDLRGNLGIGPTRLPVTVSPGGNNVGANNIGVGGYALNATTTGGNNTAVGYYALSSNTTGGPNNAFGVGALGYNQTGYFNDAFGWGALQYNVSGISNVAFGYEALYSATGNSNSVFGGGWGSWGAGRSITSGSGNSIFGFRVGGLTLTTGSSNILIGTDASTDTPASGTSNFLNLGNTIYATNMYSNSNTSGVGYVGIGTTSPQAKLEINGNLRFTADGSVQTTAWTGVLCGGDYAESVDVNGDRTKYGPGDVLVIDPDNAGKFLKSADPYSTAVLGIYSTKPGAIGRRQAAPKSMDEVPMAMIGIVPTKVSSENGPIKPGDLLVTSSTPGYAMKGTDRNRLVGAVIGKALGRLDSGTGVIEMGVTLQ
jgi:hypothetical protein